MSAKVKGTYRLNLIAAVLTVLILIPFFSFRVRSLLGEEREVFNDRATAVGIFVDEASSVVNIIHRQILTSYSWEADRSSDRNAPHIQKLAFDQKTGIYEVAFEEPGVNIVGLGDLPAIDSPVFREIFTLAKLSGMFRGVIESRFDPSWVYYYSANKFAMISPHWTGVSEDVFAGTYSYPFWTEAHPSNNPAGVLKVTDLYQDAAGLGMMVTLTQPVYSDGVFRGTACMDITSVQFDRAVSIGSSLGRTHIVDENYRMISAPFDWGVDGAFSAADQLRQNGRFTFTAALLGDEIRAIHVVELRQLIWRTFLNSFAAILVALVLNFLIFILLRLRNSYAEASDESEFSRRLLSIIGHDLQTPLSVSSQALELLERDGGSEEVLDVLKNSNQSAVTLLKDLTYWGKSRASEIVFKPEPVPINGILDSSAETVRGRADLKSISIKTAGDDGIIMIDHNVISTVLRNLLSNAVKFTSSGGVVRIDAVRENGDFTVFRVSDTGRGMSEEQIRQFHRRNVVASKVGTGGEKGSGVGLTIVTALCRQAGWDISVSSKIEEGTVFSIRIPTEN